MVQGSELCYRSHDKGATFTRERGLHSLYDMTLAFNAAGQAVATGLRGVFRFETMPPASMPGAAGGSGVGGAGAGGSGTAGGGAANGAGAAATPSGAGSSSTPGAMPGSGGGESSGCGCSVPGRASPGLPFAWLVLALPWLRRRRAR